MEKSNFEKEIKEKLKNYLESTMKPENAVLAFKTFIQTLNFTCKDGYLEVTTNIKKDEEMIIEYISKKYGQVIVEAAGVEKSKVIFKKPECNPEKTPNKESYRPRSTNNDTDKEEEAQYEDKIIAQGGGIFSQCNDTLKGTYNKDNPKA